MRGPSLANTLLFWSMLLVGTAAVAPCLVLPAWLERQAQFECLRAREEFLAGQQQRLETARKQIEHLNDDPAYIVRLAEQDFGGALKVPDIETIWIDASSSAAAESPPPPSVGPPPPESPEPLWPELDDFIQVTMQRYPEAHLFVDQHSRPWILGAGGALLISAILLLGLSGPGRAGHAPKI
jgi:hypothetical protein